MELTKNRTYQTNVVRKVCKAYRDGAKSVLIIAPTGSGKTRMACSVIKTMNFTPICLAHRREICEQIDKELQRIALPKYLVSGVMGHKVAPSIQSEEFDSVFIDEGHHIPAKSYRRVVDSLGGKRLLSVTATPYRSDSANIAKYFDTIVEAPSARELAEEGYLANVEYVSSDAVDFTGIKRNVRNDYDESDALRRVRISVQAGDLIESWGKYAKGRNALIYAINVEHGQQILDECRSYGIPTELVTGRTGKRDRTRAINNFEQRKTRALINCQVFTEGTDLKGVGAIIMLRPTLSRPLYKQMIGRGMRPDCKCVVLDHVGNYQRHGCVMQENPLDIMRESRLDLAADSSVRSIDVSDDYIKMDLHIEKISDDLKKIWTPSIFGAPA